MDDDYDDDVDVDRWGDLARIDRRFFLGVEGVGRTLMIRPSVHLFIFIF